MAAAGRERRAERLNERLRGAQRANLEDDSFSLNIEGLDQPPSDGIPPRRTPASLPRNRERSIDESNETSYGTSATRSAAKAPRQSDVSRQSDTPGATTTTAARGQRADGPKSSSSRAARSSSRPVPAAAADVDSGADELEGAALQPTRTRSPARSRLSVAMMEEVEESPAHAPGSGRRRNLQLSAATASSATRRMQFDMSTDDIVPPSSPLARKSRPSDVAALTRRLTPARAVLRRTMSGEVDELVSEDGPRLSSPTEERSRRLVAEDGELGSTLQADEADASPEEAEEINAAEAAKALRRKRPRRSMRASSPELGSAAAEEGQDDAMPEYTRKAEPMTRRKRPRDTSPATQKQPLPASRPKSKTKPKPKSKQRAQSKSQKESPPKERPKERKRKRAQASGEAVAKKRRQSGLGDDDDDVDDDAIEITVQRFANNKRAGGGGGDDDLDPLQSEIPFANHAGESVVDVLAQVCNEVIAGTLAQFQRLDDEADGAAAKKECRVKMRAIEAYREELGSRLLQHTIHLNHWRSLRKQVRHAQKEKLALRNEILRLRGEREQVALRMDAVRIKHEADSKESSHCISTSTLMNDIDVAMGQGRQAPQLPHDTRKQAGLANLELMLARVADEASSRSSTGGMLHQVTQFNAFLERAAQALESR